VILEEAREEQHETDQETDDKRQRTNQKPAYSKSRERPERRSREAEGRRRSREAGREHALELQPGRRTETGHQCLQGQLESDLRKEEEKAIQVAAGTPPSGDARRSRGATNQTPGAMIRPGAVREFQFH
jgi:hypothetical protein